MCKWESLRSFIRDIRDGNAEDVQINCSNFCLFLLEYMTVLDKQEEEAKNEEDHV